MAVPKELMLIKKSRTNWSFLTSILLQIIEKIEVGAYGAIQNFRIKPHTADKNLHEKHQGSQRGILSMFPRCSTSVLLFCFGRGSEVWIALNLISSS